MEPYFHIFLYAHSVYSTSTFSYLTITFFNLNNLNVKIIDNWNIWGF